MRPGAGAAAPLLGSSGGARGGLRAPLRLHRHADVVRPPASRSQRAAPARAGTQAYPFLIDWYCTVVGDRLGSPIFKNHSCRLRLKIPTPVRAGIRTRTMDDRNRHGRGRRERAVPDHLPVHFSGDITARTTPTARQRLLSFGATAWTILLPRSDLIVGGLVQPAGRMGRAHEQATSLLWASSACLSSRTVILP